MCLFLATPCLQHNYGWEQRLLCGSILYLQQLLCLLDWLGILHQECLAPEAGALWFLLFINPLCWYPGIVQDLARCGDSFLGMEALWKQWFKEKYCLCLTALSQRRRERISPKGFNTLWWAGWGSSWVTPSHLTMGLERDRKGKSKKIHELR